MNPLDSSRTTPSSIRSVNAVTLATHDMPRAIRFYQDMGFQVRYGGGDSDFTSLHAGTGYLNLIAVPKEQTWSWWGRIIFHVEDVDTFYDRALAAGLKPHDAPRDAEWQERYFHLTDPDGHELSFATPIKSG